MSEEITTTKDVLSHYNLGNPEENHIRALDELLSMRASFMEISNDEQSPIWPHIQSLTAAIDKLKENN